MSVKPRVANSLEFILHSLNRLTGGLKERVSRLYQGPQLDTAAIIEAYSHIYDAAVAYGRDRQQPSASERGINRVRQVLSRTPLDEAAEDLGSLESLSKKYESEYHRRSQELQVAFNLVEHRVAQYVIEQLFGKPTARTLTGGQLAALSPDILESNKERFAFYNLRKNTYNKLVQLGVLPSPG